MILFSIHLPSKWTSAEGRGSPLYPGCHSRTSSHYSGRWLSRLLSQGCLLKRMAEEEGLNTESAEEQPGVSPSCQQGNNVLGSSVATDITPHFKPPRNVRWELPFPCRPWLRFHFMEEVKHHHLFQLHQQQASDGIHCPNNTGKTVFWGILIKGWGAKGDRAGTNLAVASLRNSQAPGSEPKLSDGGSPRSMTSLSLPLLKIAREIKIWGF